jgi:hypothetical protein
MDQINKIRAQFRPHMGWHGSRLSFIVLFLVALFRAKTVNLAELATVWLGNAEEASNYKRMQRFFKSFDAFLIIIINHDPKGALPDYSRR